MAADYGIRPRGFRLPDATRVGAVGLQVSDLARSIAYYVNTIGLAVVDQSQDRAALGAADGHVLVQLETRPGVQPAHRRASLGLFHFAILLPDRASLGRFLTHLGAIGEPVAMSDHAVSEALYLTDPDGLGIEVYADRPRASWRLADDRQLYMTTAPLDAASVVAAANSEPWNGMPAGTTLGHMHLHVGDLSEAERFYHHALGFDKVVWNYPGALFLSAGGYHHHLGTNTWVRGAPPPDHLARLLSWDIILPSGRDVDAAADSLASAGYVVDRDGLGARIAADPWQTQLRLVAA